MKLLVCMIVALAGMGLLRGEELPGLKEPLKTVTEKYLVVQQKLAADSFDGVTAAASEMKTAMSTGNSFAPDFVAAVDTLIAAKDLHTARLAFPQVSEGLIAALAQSQVQTGSLHSAYCPMVKAYWVQTDGKVVHNPYYGAAMPDCGAIQRQF